jgi:TonB family protein
VSMNRFHAGLLVILLGALSPSLGHASCVADPPRLKTPLSSEALEIRNALFLRLCQETHGLLVDGNDQTLGRRLKRAHGLTMRKSQDVYPSGGSEPRQRTGIVILTFMVAADGSVNQITVLQGSGSPRLDAQAVEVWETAHYKSSATLDGRHVPSLEYTKVRFVNGESPPNQRLERP